VRAGTGAQRRRHPTAADSGCCGAPGMGRGHRSLQTVKSRFPEQSTDTAPALQRPGLGAWVWWKTWWSWRSVGGLWVLSRSCGLRSRRDRYVSNRHVMVSSQRQELAWSWCSRCRGTLELCEGLQEGPRALPQPARLKGRCVWSSVERRVGGSLLRHWCVSGFVENRVNNRRLSDLVGGSSAQSDDCKVKQPDFSWK